MKIKKKLPALTLTELMVVLVIIGILILLALPNLTGLFGQAYSLEAKKQLKYIQSLQQGYYQLNFRYTDNFNELRFDPPKLKSEDGDAVYRYEIVNAGKNNFVARATAPNIRVANGSKFGFRRIHRFVENLIFLDFFFEQINRQRTTSDFLTLFNF